MGNEGRLAKRRQRGVLGGALPLGAAVLAACGGSAGPAATTGARPATPRAVSTAASTPTPTPAPAPPVVVITQSQNPGFVLEAMDAAGTPLWSAPYHTSPEFSVAGPRIFVADYQARTVTVYDRTGHSAGTANLPSSGTVVFSPTSAEWAWSAVDSTSPSPVPASSTQQVTVSGSFWVAGIGEAAHRVYRWTRTGRANQIQPFDALAQWSDQGLVSSPPPPAAPCAQESQTVSYVVDPTSGARTDLASDGRGVVDVHAGVVAAFTDPQTVVLSGRTQFTWTNTPAAPGEKPTGVARVSPAGTTVMVPLTNNGCAGQQPEQRTAFINVAAHSVSFVSGVFGDGWLDDTHVIAAVLGSGPNPELDVVGLDGSRSLLGHGNPVGVLTAA